MSKRDTKREFLSETGDENSQKKLQRLCDKALVESAGKKNNVVWSYRVKDRLETFRLELVVGACLAFGMMIFLLLSN